MSKEFYTDLQFGKTDLRQVHVYENQGFDMTVKLNDNTLFTEHYNCGIFEALEKFKQDVLDQENGSEKPPINVLVSGDKDFQMSEDLADRFCEEINDFLSEKYGYCTNGWSWELNITDIDWDTEE